MTSKVILAVLLFIIGNYDSVSQEKNKKYFVQWTTWALTQTIPSPVFFHDNNGTSSHMLFGLRWNVAPVNYSFNTNRFISPVSFFMVNPLNRYGGSIEIILQPEWSTAPYKYSDLNRFQLGSGIRGYIPLIEEGEDLSLSIGGKYRFRNDSKGKSVNAYAAELGIYTFFGIFGIQLNYNFTSQSRFDVGLSLKYY